MKIEHIAMYVNDLERAKDFFTKYFNAAADAGYLNQTTGFRSYFLTFEDGARLEIMNQPDLVDNEKVLLRTGYVHIAFRVGNRASVDTLTERLKRDGYHVAFFSHIFYHTAISHLFMEMECRDRQQILKLYLINYRRVSSD